MAIGLAAGAWGEKLQQRMSGSVKVHNVHNALHTKCQSASVQEQAPGCTHKSKLEVHQGEKHDCTNATNTLHNAPALPKYEHVRIILKITTVAETMKCDLAQCTMHIQSRQSDMRNH